MSFKKASLIALTIMIGLGAVGIFLATQINDIGVDSFVGGPKFYPMMLLGIVIIFGIWDFILTLKETDERKFTIPEIKRLGVSILMVAAWIVLWKYAIGFYPAGVLMAFLMLYYLNPETNKAKKIKSAVIADVLIMGAIYVIFTVLFTVRF